MAMPDKDDGNKADPGPNEIDSERMARLDHALEEALRTGSVDSSLVEPDDLPLLESLFESARRDLPGLDQSVVAHKALSDGLAATINDDEALHAGDRVGAFRLERCIGRGGMGTVFLARRHDGGFVQTVALKILSQRSSDPAGFQLFQRERDLLARLQHPGIARLIDGGMTQGWRPWFAMEYIDGQPIDRYARQHRLTLDERLELFLKVCDALSHAHRQLVLHRDIKPGNLLVDADGQVRIVDFGLGGVADPERDSSPDQTLITGRLTPDYASPEQARGEAIRVTSEVYQLGLVLYQLVCSQRPYRIDAASAWTLANSISQAVIPRPSMQWAQPAGQAGEYRTSSAQLARQLRGDIDNIVLKALANDPDERYPSVEALASDLRRHLRQLPIEARVATRRYRLSRFIRRNRAAVTVGIALTLALCGGLVMLSLQAGELARERDRMVAENERNQRLIEAMSQMIRLADADQSADQIMTLGQRLEQYRTHIDDNLVDDPEARRHMLAIVGEAMSKVGYWRQAADALREAHSMSIETLGQTHPETVSLGLSLATAEGFHGDMATAEALLSGLIDSEGDSRVDQESRHRADALYTRGYLRTYHLAENNPRWQRGIDDLEDALALYRQRFDGPTEKVARTLHWLGVKHPETERRLEMTRRALDMTVELHGPRHVITASRTAELALVHDRLEQYDEAIELGRKAHEIYADARGQDHPQTLTILSNLAGSLRMNGQVEDAVDIYRQVHETRTQVLPEDHLLLSFTAHGMGNALRELGRLRESETWLREALRLCLKHGSRNEAVTRVNLSRTLEAADRLDHAVAQQRLALQAFQAHYGPDAAITGEAENRLSSLLSRLE